MPIWDTLQSERYRPHRVISRARLHQLTHKCGEETYCVRLVLGRI